VPPLRRQPDRHAHRWNLSLPVVALCLLLVVLLFAMLAVHQHPFGADSDHCQLCVALHSAAPIALCVAEIVLVLLGLSALAVRRDTFLRPCLDQHNPRPPPAIF
jgi:hypothetical protein